MIKLPFFVGFTLAIAFCFETTIFDGTSFAGGGGVNLTTAAVGFNTLTGVSSAVLPPRRFVPRFTAFVGAGAVDVDGFGTGVVYLNTVTYRLFYLQH